MGSTHNQEQAEFDAFLLLSSWKRMRNALSPKKKQWILGVSIGLAGILALSGVTFGVLHGFYGTGEEVLTNNPGMREMASDRTEESTDNTECAAPKNTISNGETLNAILDNINALAPLTPAPGTRWTTERIEFVDATHAYAVYSDSVAKRRILVESSTPCVQVRVKRLAYFEPESEGWRRLDGNDPYADFAHEQLAVYEFYEPNKEWLPLDAIEQRERERLERERQEQASPEQQPTEDHEESLTE